MGGISTAAGGYAGGAGEEEVKIDPESLNWLETELSRIRYGEVGLIFILHDGRITKRKKILEIKEQEDLTDSHGNV